MLDPRTGFQRGCNSCWESIQDTVNDYVEDEDVPVIISLEDIQDLEFKYLEEDEDESP